MNAIMKTLGLLIFALLSLTSMVNSAPATTTNHYDSGYANQTADVASIQARWEPGQKVTTILEPGDTVGGLGHPGPWELALDTCAPNTADWTMCTVTYIEKSTWGGWGVVMLYDNWCNRIGYNDHVARNWLSSFWSLSSALRMYVDIKITNAWTDSMNKGVEVSYHKYHSEPFVKNPYPQWNNYLWKDRIPSHEAAKSNSHISSHTASLMSQMPTATMQSIIHLIFLLLALISPVISAPAAGSNSIVEENHGLVSRNTSNISAILSPLEDAWVPGEPATIFVESGAHNIYYKSCEPNGGDQYQCTVSFVQSNAADYAYMWIYDHQCRQIGFNGHVSREDLADRFSMSSQLPNYVDVNIERGWNPTHPSGVKVWYGAFYSPEPFLLPPQQWLAQLNRDILESNTAGRYWWFMPVAKMNWHYYPLRFDETDSQNGGEDSEVRIHQAHLDSQLAGYAKEYQQKREKFCFIVLQTFESVGEFQVVLARDYRVSTDLSSPPNRNQSQTRTDFSKCERPIEVAESATRRNVIDQNATQKFRESSWASPRAVFANTARHQELGGAAFACLTDSAGSTGAAAVYDDDDVGSCAGEGGLESVPVEIWEARRVTVALAESNEASMSRVEEYKQVIGMRIPSLEVVQDILGVGERIA
ncbi:hypothetical protein BKA65DRAFT_474158 [Rhexocercosporidium sp. MPI-PUGE-AT-0058]|nr:hypothetical protein BKA65DRAFT_474158 [Rhexocercosporidium sp. MPI-PUGE-AT-0058]